jgi:hypothetical protein
MSGTCSCEVLLSGMISGSVFRLDNNFLGLVGKNVKSSC